MLAAAIGKGAHEASGCEVLCLVADDEVIKQSRATGETRSAIALRKAAPRLDGGIIAIGNAPTALHEAITLCEQGKLTPALIIGLPVGFVEARESKERLWASGLVCITNLDRKGGTPATAAALNALLRLARGESS
jgi:precorrin-8X/cobalt-precorrin-8 methylmutase